MSEVPELADFQIKEVLDGLVAHYREEFRREHGLPTGDEALKPENLERERALMTLHYWETANLPRFADEKMNARWLQTRERILQKAEAAKVT